MSSGSLRHQRSGPAYSAGAPDRTRRPRYAQAHLRKGEAGLGGEALMIAWEAGRPALITPRLRLRFPRPADAPEIAWYANDLDVARMTTGIPHPYGLEQARAFLDRVEMMNPDEE